MFNCTLKKKAFTVAAFTWLVCSPFDNSYGCTFTWTPVTTSVSGSTIPVDHYTVYEQESGKTAVALNLTSSYVAPKMVSSLYNCKQASYWVTATSVAGIESPPSNVLIVEQPKAVIDLTLTKP